MRCRRVRFDGDRRKGRRGLLELGSGTGRGLWMWNEYFGPEASFDIQRLTAKDVAPTSKTAERFDEISERQGQEW